LWREVWSYTLEIRQVVSLQKESCCAALAYPPAASSPMSVFAPSEERVTWYSGPLYAENSARVVLCAATHGVPAEP
jgi:hypothetical protein